jgi:hypothetical protein
MLFIKVRFFYKYLINQNLLFLCIYFDPIISFQALNLYELFIICANIQFLLLILERISKLQFLEFFLFFLIFFFFFLKKKNLCYSTIYSNNSPFEQYSITKNICVGVSIIFFVFIL